MRMRPRDLASIDRLPEINRENPDLLEFLKPVDDVYNLLVKSADQLSWLRRYDKCPREHLPLLASMIGCQLPIHRVATEIEQRMLIKWWSWCCTYKGMLTAVKQLCAVLGFTTEFVESARAAAVWTQSPFYCYDERILARVVNDIFDGSQAEQWAKRLPGSEWLHINGHFEGTGDGTDSLNNNCVFGDYRFDLEHMTQCYQVDFEVMDGSGSLFPSFGAVLYSQSIGLGTFVRFESYGGHDYVKTYALWGDVPIPLGSQDITGLVDYKTGMHHLIIWDFYSSLSIGIDDRLIARNLPGLSLSREQGLAGLSANEATHMYFDRFTVDRLSISSFSHFFGTDAYERHLLIRYSYTGDPDAEIGKLEYLAQILPGFVPVGVDIEFQEV